MKVTLTKKEVIAIISKHYGIKDFEVEINSLKGDNDELCVMHIDREITVLKQVRLCQKDG